MTLEGAIGYTVFVFLLATFVHGAGEVHDDDLDKGWWKQRTRSPRHNDYTSRRKSIAVVTVMFSAPVWLVLFFIPK